MKEWEKNVRRVEPYVPGEQPKAEGIIKLNTNENPYPPSPEARAAAVSFDTDTLRLYPDPHATRLVNAIADCYEIDNDRVFVGVGSDDVISMAFLTFFNSDKPVFFPDISYSFYSVWAELYKIPYRQIPLDDGFRIVSSDYYEDNGGIIFPNPNAPTGLYKPLDEIEDIVAHNRGSVVIVDEAYIDFGGESALKLTEKYDNLLVVQTFSKSRSMAGLRIGYAIGSSELIKALNDVKFSVNSYTMNRTAIEYGVEAVKDKDYLEYCTQKITATRERTEKELAVRGFSFPESTANFIFATHKTAKASYIYEELKKQGIYVRYFDKPRIDNYLRITIGTDEQMDRLFAVLDDIL